MTDNNEKIDLDKEIADLENLLDSNDESFSLDGFDHELSAPVKEKESGGGAGKYIIYIAFLALVSGGGYAAYKYIPPLLKNNDLATLQQNITDRVARFEPQNIVPDIANNAIDPVVAPVVDVVSPVPSPEISNYDEIMILDDTDMVPETTDNTNAIDLGFGDGAGENIAIEPAETIADALAITQNITNEDVVTTTPDVMMETVDNVTQEMVDVANDITILDEPTPLSDSDAIDDLIDFVDDEAPENLSFERIESQPLRKNTNVGTDIAVDLGALDDAVIETANDVMTMDKQDLIETVEGTSMTEPEIVIEDAPILEAPIEVKAIAVETPKAEPVKIKSQTSSKPKAITVNNKPLKKVDARVTQARTLMNNNDYAAALDMYEAVLAADPTSTPALTGRQLAKAKMRMTVNTPTIAVESSKPHTSAPIEPIEPMVASELDGLISTMNANPRDAQSVLAVAEYYGAQGDKASAVAFYRKALQLDMIYKSGIDRTAISAAITAVQ